MIFTETELPGAFIIDVDRMSDERGFFARSWCEDEFAAHGILMPPLQANVSSNPTKGTLRGMHFQLAPYEETKLVRCTRGSIFLVMVDLRPDSPTRNEWLGVELGARSERLAYVPEGFAQGYQTLEDDTEVLYQMSHPYVPQAARVRDRELAQAGLGLAGVHERLQHPAIEVMGDRLAVEEADDDRVGAGVGRG